MHAPLIERLHIDRLIQAILDLTRAGIKRLPDKGNAAISTMAKSGLSGIKQPEEIKEKTAQFHHAVFPYNYRMTDQELAIIASPNSEQLTFFAPSIKRCRS